MDVLDKVEKQASLEDILSIFNDPGCSDYLVVYLRYVAIGCRGIITFLLNLTHEGIDSFNNFL